MSDKAHISVVLTNAIDLLTGATYVKAGQVPASFARIVRSITKIRRYRQMVCVDWER